MDSFQTKGKRVIALPEAPFMVRINKVMGMFAKGQLDASDPKTVTTNGLGKWIEGVVVNVEVNLFGKIGQGDSCDWVLVSLLITDSDMPKKLRPGLLVHFFCAKYEAEFFIRAKTEAEIAELFGDADETPQILRLEFDKSIQTQFGSTIKPPTATFRDASKEEMDFVAASETIHAEWKHKLPDPFALEPASLDGSGKLIKGLVPADAASDVLAVTGA